MSRALPPSMTIRPAGENEARALSRLEAEVFSDPWSESMLRETLARPETVSLCAWEEKADAEFSAGFILLRTVADECEILRIAVRREYRRLGVGRILLENGLGAAKKRGAAAVFLEVRESNGAARAFYEVQQFEITGKRPGYYNDNGEAAIMMYKAL